MQRGFQGRSGSQKNEATRKTSRLHFFARCCVISQACSLGWKTKKSQTYAKLHGCGLMEGCGILGSSWRTPPFFTFGVDADSKTSLDAAIVLELTILVYACSFGRRKRATPGPASVHTGSEGARSLPLDLFRSDIGTCVLKCLHCSLERMDTLAGMKRSRERPQVWTGFWAL